MTDTGRIVVCTEYGEIIVCENTGEYKAFVEESPLEDFKITAILPT